MRITLLAFLIILILVTLTIGSTATAGPVQNYGPNHIVCYSGGTKIYEATFAIDLGAAPYEARPYWNFRDSKTGEPVFITADCVANRIP